MHLQENMEASVSIDSSNSCISHNIKALHYIFLISCSLSHIAHFLSDRPVSNKAGSKLVLLR